MPAGVPPERPCGWDLAGLRDVLAESAGAARSFASRGTGRPVETNGTGHVVVNGGDWFMVIGYWLLLLVIG